MLNLRFSFLSVILGQAGTGKGVYSTIGCPEFIKATGVAISQTQYSMTIRTVCPCWLAPKKGWKKSD